MSKQRVYLEAWDVDRDVAAYEAIVCSPEVAEFLGEPDSDPVPQGPLLDHGPDHISVTGAVWHDDDLVGAIWLSWFGSIDDSASVTVAIRPDAAGRGYGRGAVAEAAKLARTIHPTLPISGTVAARNTRSIAMVTHLGGTLVPSIDDDSDYFTVRPAGLPATEAPTLP